MSTAAAWLSAALVVSAPVAAAEAQAPGRTARWAALVEAHAPGELDEAALEVAAWSRDETSAAIPSAEASSKSTAFLGRAMLFHTDIAIAQRAAFDLGLPAGLAGKVLILDPTEAGVRQRAVHWDAGRRLAALLAKRPDGAAAAARWFAASGALLFELGDVASLVAHLEAGLARFPDEPSLLVLRGTYHQALADGRVQGYARRLRSHASEALRSNADGVSGEVRVIELGRRSVVSGDTAIELARAEAIFRRAIGRDASLSEARIRLAHVLERQARWDDALEAVAPALTATLSPRIEYYAALVAGRCEQRLGRTERARAAYERAARAVPGGQAARIALSQLAIVEGRGSAALAALTSGLADDTGPDPWWSYLRLHEPSAKALLAALRDGL
jgi:tetratricopeptide (TPR) repeat protein